MSNLSFNINPKSKKGSERDKKITDAADAGQPNAARILQKKGKGPSLPGRTSDMRRIAGEEVKLVDKILGEEKCGKGMYWCKKDNKCKKISSSHGGDIGANKGELDEDVTIEDAFGNKFVEFIDLIKPESLLSQREEKDHEVSMAHQQIKKSQENLKKVKKSIGKKEKNLPAWMQAKLTDTEHNTDAVAGYNTKESMDLAKADMGNVIKDFRKSKKPQFKGKSDKKIRQMAIASKLEAERQSEEFKLDEAVRLPSEFGHLISVIVVWRGNTQYIRMFFPQAKIPNRKEIQAEIEKVYPGGRVVQFSTSDLPSNHANFDSPLFKVTKEEKEVEESCCKKCKKSPCKCSESVDEGLKQARKNVGAKKCWKGYTAKGTKIKNGRQVPNCVPEEIDLDERKIPVTRQAGDFRYSGRTGEEKAERRAKVLSNSPDAKKRRQANTIRSKIKTVADRDTAQASSNARQKLYRGQQRRANDLAQQLISKNRNESVNEDVNISGGSVGTIVIGGDLPKK